MNTSTNERSEQRLVSQDSELQRQDGQRASVAQSRRTLLIQFMAKHHLTIPRHEIDNWRMVDPVVGQIDALPTSRGTVKATNGILCYIEREDGTLFLGHYDWFVPDETQVVKTGRASKLDLSAYETL